MLGRGVGEARRKIVFLGLSAFLLMIILVGTRRQDQVKEWVDYSRLESQYHLSGGSHSAFSSSLLSGGTANLLDGEEGPVLGKGDRSLSRKSLIDLRNSTLGVWSLWHHGFRR